MSVDTSFLLRVDIHGDESEFRSKIVNWVGKQGNAIGCYECPRDGNGHYHIWLRCAKTCASLRQNFKYNFPECKGNRSYSIKQEDGNLQYIAKGDCEDEPPIIFLNTMGILDEDIKKAKSERWAKTKELEKKKEKNELKQKKSAPTWFALLMMHCKDKGCTASSNGWEIARAIIDAYRVYVKCEPNDFQIKCYAKSIQRELVYERSCEDDKPHIYENYLQARAKQIIGMEWVHPVL